MVALLLLRVRERNKRSRAKSDACPACRCARRVPSRRGKRRETAPGRTPGPVYVWSLPMTVRACSTDVVRATRTGRVAATHEHERI